jgi:hypothetical protein
LRSIIEAEETVDEIEMLSVDEFIFELRIPNLLPALLGSELPLLGVALPFCGTPCSFTAVDPECRFEAEAVAKPRGKTGGAPLGGVRGSAVECEVSLLEELEVKLVLPNFLDEDEASPDESVLLELLSSERDIAFLSLFLKRLEVEPDLPLDGV